MPDPDESKEPSQPHPRPPMTWRLFAQRTIRISALAANWVADSMDPLDIDHRADALTVKRFTDDVRQRLARLDEDAF